MIVADTLSRSPVSTHDSIDLQEDVHVFISEVVSSWPVSDARLKEIRKETQKDVNRKTALEYTISGWPVSVQFLRNYHNGFDGDKNNNKVLLN